MLKLELTLTEAELEKLVDCVTSWCDKGPLTEGWQGEVMQGVAEKVMGAIHKSSEKEMQK